MPVDREPDEVQFDDDLLADLALAAEPFDPFAPDVERFDGPAAADGLLPSWYMPAPSGRRTPKRTVVFGGLVLALLVIDIMGLCVTYGIPDPVWK